ncbi:MAG TPA: PIN domain-containing protein [Pyrinomonadaceae bacterium]
MRVLLDTDVVLDVVLAREPFAQESAQLFRLHEQGKIDAYIAAITPINVFYVTRKLKGRHGAQRAIELLLNSLSVCPVSHSVLHQAYRLPFGDYEDAVQHASATASGLDTIVTRNINDYKNSTLPIFSPTDFLAKLKSEQK